MKKILAFFSCFAFLAACGGGNESEYDKYYDSDREEASGQADDGPVAQTKIGAGASVNVMIDSVGDAIQGEANAQGETKVQGNAKAQGQTYDQGAKLIALSDCLSCHREEDRLVGPAYVEVAKKYAFNDKNVDYLAGKIIEGGAGVWGQVPMTPHPDMSKEEAREMARYILSLNRK